MARDPGGRQTPCAAYDFSAVTSIADIGGSNGALLRKILERNPAANGIVSDREDVIAAIAPDMLDGRRIEAVGGDCFAELRAATEIYSAARLRRDRVARNRRDGEQPAHRLLDHPVALAGSRLQTRAVERRDVPASIADEPRALQFGGRIRDAFAAHAEKAGDQFLGHPQFVRRNPV